MDDFEDYYEILQLEDTADEREIQRAARQKMFFYHPDRHPPNDHAIAEIQFQRIVRARDVLLDGKLREAYDHKRLERRTAQLRIEELDSVRRQHRESLLQREKGKGDKSAAPKYGSYHLAWTDVDRALEKLQRWELASQGSGLNERNHGGKDREANRAQLDRLEEEILSQLENIGKREVIHT